MPTPIYYKPEYEQISDDEAKTVEEISELMQQILDTTYADYGHPVRSVHAKSHAILLGEVTVKDHLPEHLAQGIFSTPKTYSAIMRVSTNPGDILDDNVSTPRGLALKIFDVEGERLAGSEDSQVQDFVMANGEVFSAPSPQVFAKNLKLLAATTDKAEGLKKVLSSVLQTVEGGLEKLGHSSPTLVTLGGQQKTSVVGESFFTQAPLLYGPYMAKLRVVPISDALKSKTDEKVDLKDKPNGLREDALNFFKKHGGEWELQVQLNTDIDKMPIEDASVAWDEEESPYVTVATISVKPQSSWDDARVKRVDDEMAFSPWRGITAHRPIGAVMRSRKAVYELSANFRSTHNPAPVHEPRCPFHF